MRGNSQSQSYNSNAQMIFPKMRSRKLSMILNVKRRRFGKLDVKIVLLLVLFIIVIRNSYTTSSKADDNSDIHTNRNNDEEYDFEELEDDENLEENNDEEEDEEDDEEDAELKIMHISHHHCNIITNLFNGQKEEPTKQKKKWTRASGEDVHTWLSSFPEMFKEKDEMSADQPTNLYAKFRSFISGKLILDEVGHTGLGVLWRKHGRQNCDGWLYGQWKVTNNSKSHIVPKEPTDEWEFSGGTGYGDPNKFETTLAYIYQDMRTAIVGKFFNGVLIRGFHRRIVGYKCMEGILILKFSKSNKNDKLKLPYRYESPNSSFITSTPKLMDPYEKSTIYINGSTIPGMKFSEGIFAKRRIPRFRLVAVYAGVLLQDSEYHDNFDDVPDESYDDVHKNLIELNDDITIDVPPQFTSIVDYRSSLGHKANLKLDEDEVNAEFGEMNHPRFGLVRCIRSTRDIEPGEEIYVDYGYGEEEEDWQPNWYKNILWERNEDYDI